ncbi:MAG: glutamate formimidoyltransferase [Planctomycetes bacterium]|nr:glutamate formimidoyltransferase [Planctomycetota bacterium]
MAIVECVPNFSEGRRKDIVARIVAAITDVPGVTLLGSESDPDHNRSVITFAGEPGAVAEAAFRCAARARDLIDLRQHQGEHPRMGATDVVPFIPVQGCTMQDCARLAEQVAERIARELDIPTYLYAEAARQESRRKLADVRQGEFEGLREEVPTNAARKPDFGPARLHESAGATAVGARFFLVAYNVNLESRDLKLAKAIAKAIREKDGGLPGVQAMGFELAAEGCVQVSMNLLDFRKTSPEQVFERIRELAGKQGVAIRESELVGLVPQAALPANAGAALKIKNFNPANQIIEEKLGMSKFPYMTQVGHFLDALASDSPTPGGGAAAAVLGAIGIALGEMVGNLTVGKKKYADVQDKVKAELGALTPMRPKMLALFAEDAQAFEAFGDAGKLPKDTDEQKAARKVAMQKALKGATLTPDKTAAMGVEAFRHLYQVALVGNKHAISDCGVGALSLYASICAAVQNMRINLPGIEDTAFRAEYGARAEAFEKEARELLDKSLKVVRDAIAG